MEAIIVALLGKTENIAILVSVAGNLGLGYLHIVWRREERLDRQTAFAALEKVTEALNEVKVAIALLTGKIQ